MCQCQNNSSCSSCNTTNSGYGSNRNRKNSLLSTNNKGIKFYKESIVINEGVNQLAKMNICDLNIPFEQYFTTNMILPAETLDREIQYGFLGDHITFVALKVTYETKNTGNGCNRYGLSCSNSDTELTTDDLNYDDDGFVSDEEPFIEYSFKTNPGEKRYIKDFMILTGTETRRIPKLILSNRHKDFNAKIEMLVSTNRVVIGDITHNQPSESLNTIDNLLYNKLISDSQGLSILDENNNELIYIIWDKISNIEINGKIITIDDIAIGKTNLIFINETNACQAHSLIQWAISDPYTRIITGTNGIDDVAPVITYASTFTTDIVLADYPVNGTNGTDGYLITLDDLLTLEIDSVIDDRDGQIYPYHSNITLTLLGDLTKIDAISDLGKYQMTFEFTDIACNSVIESFVLNIKDENPPVQVLSSLGYEVYLSNSNSTSGPGYITIPQTTKLYIDDFNSNKITKQDLINLLLSQVYDTRDGDILRHINNIHVEIEEYNTNIIYNTIETEGFYTIKFYTEDSDQNGTYNLWRDLNTDLNISELVIFISENKSPVVTFNTYSPLFLGDFGTNTITKNDLIISTIDSIIDDRDGSLVVTSMNINIFQIAECPLGDVCVPSFGTNGTGFVGIVPVELVYIDTQGRYTIRVMITDSDGATTIAEDDFDVFY